MKKNNRTELFQNARKELIDFKSQNINNSGYYLESDLLHTKEQILKNNKIYNDPNNLFGKFRLILVFFGAGLAFYVPFYFSKNIIISFLLLVFFGCFLYEVLHKILVKNYLKNINYSKLTLDLIRIEGELNLKNNLIFIQYLVLYNHDESVIFLGKPQTQVPSKEELLNFQDFNNVNNFSPSIFPKLIELDFFNKLYKVENVIWHSGAVPQNVTIEIVEYNP